MFIFFLGQSPCVSKWIPWAARLPSMTYSYIAKPKHSFAFVKTEDGRMATILHCCAVFLLCFDDHQIFAYFETHPNLRTAGTCCSENDYIVGDILCMSLSEMIYLSISTYDFKITQPYHGFIFISFKTV